MDKLGTRLALIIKQDIGVRLLRIKTADCPTCESWVDQINLWGVKGLRKYRHLVESHLLEQAAAKTLFVVAWTAPMAQKRIAGWIDLAIKEQELAERRESG